MTKEEAKAVLLMQMTSGLEANGTLNDAIHIAMESIDRQIPKKYLIEQVDGFDEKVCPVCGKRYMMYLPNNFRGMHCNGCGQLLEGVDA